jgi:uncharacterized SAM-binding protein YcdF (DUF218 family)
MFFFRRLVDVLLAPLTLTVLALVLGVVMRSRAGARVQRFGTRLIGAGIIALLCLSYGIPFDFVARALENRYPAASSPSELTDVRWIVVLGGGTNAVPERPVTAWPGEGSLYRIVEGVRLHRALPVTKIVFSGYDAGNTMTSAAVGAALAKSLGVAAEAIVTEERPRTTGEEAARLKEIVGGERFLLVTSALHMPRAMMLFTRAGMKPIAAPTGHRSGERRTLADWLQPSAGRIVLAEATWHELLGLVAASLGR